MPIKLTPHNPEWFDEYERTRRELLGSLGPGAVAAIEHIGSTAVPNLCAKPIVDVLIGTENLCRLAHIEPVLTGLNYLPWHSVADRASFERRDKYQMATHHVHVVVHGGQQWMNQIAFRDHLRGNEGARKAYEQLKQRLAMRYGNTQDYSDAKSEFIQGILAGL